MKKKIAFVLLCIMMVAGAVGCASFADYLTPAKINTKAVEYVVGADVAPTEKYVTNFPYPNLVLAEELINDVDSAHQVIQLDLRQQVEKDTLAYTIHRDATMGSVLSAQQQRDLIFGEEGILTLGLGMLGMGGLAGLAGLMRKRPGDWTKEDVDNAMEAADLEVEIKGDQIVEIVKGIETFKKDLTETPDILSALKNALNTFQSQHTKQAVALTKADL